VLGVPAKANSNQRFLTVDAFRRGGFSVLGLLNEPLAASLEYGRRHTSEGRLLVYDLGGGRFDASLVEVDSDTRPVIASEGTSVFGGDDFDLVLAELALGSESVAVLEATDLFRLLEECRRQKEALHSSSRKIVLDLDAVHNGLGQATFSVSELYEVCRPLLEPSLESTHRLAGLVPIDAICLAGGGSKFPLVARVLREEFGHKVKHSECAGSATAIGLAIQADPNSGHKLREVFTRNFGVWREGYAGQLMIFDLIFSRGTRLPSTGELPLSVHRRYSPVHNVGYFRYLEASNIDEFGEPAGDITIWDEILFPFDPALAESQSLEAVFPVTRSGRAAVQDIEERYTCDAAGMVTVSICNLTSHYAREYRLGQWSGKATVVAPPCLRRARKASILPGSSYE
jgi:molecular chaperone DnaK (HSP70)